MQTFTSAYIGFNPSQNSPILLHCSKQYHQTADSHLQLQMNTVTPIADVPNVWGVVTNLCGLMTYFTIFGDSLSAYNVRILYNKGIAN